MSEAPKEGQGFSFQNYFEEASTQPLGHERPEPQFQSVKIDRPAFPPGSQAEQQQQKPAQSKVPAVIPIMTWITLSGAVILMNKYILSDLGFNKPILLTTIHVAVQTVATRVLRSQTSLLDQARDLETSGQMNRHVFLTRIVPIGALFSLSLILSNWVYLRISVSFIQMIKAITPVVVLAVSVLFKLKQPSHRLFGTVGLISVGVAVASYGEIEFDMLGFLVQLLAIIIESFRIVLIQILLQSWNLSPLVSLYYFAPVVMACNLTVVFPIEGLEAFYMALDLGIPLLLFNAAMTFGLNLASVWLIGSASGLVLTLAGVIKDILLIVGSFLLLGSTITGIQILGYAVALAGLIAFKRMSS